MTRVKGDSMEPEFREGDVVIVNTHVEAKPGDYVIVKNDEEEATFRHSDGDCSRFTLHDSQTFNIVGKIVEKKKRY